MKTQRGEQAEDTDTGWGKTRRTVLKGLGGVGIATAVRHGDSFGIGRTATAQETQGESWPQFQYDTRNGGHAPDNTGPQSDVGVRWRFQTGGQVTSSPAVVDGTVYIGSKDSTIYAIDAESGTREWEFETGGPVSSSPTVVNQTVYCGSDDGNVYALSTDDGSKRWQFETEAEVTSNPKMVDGTLYVGLNSVDSVDASLYAIRTEDGSEAWSSENFGTATTVAVGNNLVYAGTGSKDLLAFDMNTGENLWSFETDDFVFSPPVLDDETVYFGSNDANIYAVDAISGEKKWQYGTERRSTISPVVVQGTVYSGSGKFNDGGTVHAIDAETGRGEWTFNTRDIVTSSPAVVDGIVYIGCVDNNIYAINKEGGSEQWQFEFDRAVIASPAVADGALYTGSLDENVYSLMQGVQSISAEQQSGRNNRSTPQTKRSMTNSTEGISVFERFGDDSSLPLALGGGGLLGVAGLGAYRWLGTDGDSASHGDGDENR